MKYDANTLDEYLAQLPDDRRYAIVKLRETIKNNIPVGFEEYFADGILFAVPHSIYPAGYHCKPTDPVPFIAIASQKHFVALYHMGVYSFDDILQWFKMEYPKHVTTKLDMGKSCIRFKKTDQIPYELIADLCKKITVEMWIEKYQKYLKK